MNGNNINLKGFQILGSNSITAKATLNIYDYSQVKRYYTITDDGVWHLQDDYSEGCVTVTGGMITGGSEAKGGAINISGPKNRVNLYGGNLFNNKAKEQGGAIHAEKFAQFVMKGGAILNNKSAKQGGAINLYYGSSAYIEGGKISYNTSESGGGAIYVYWEGTDTTDTKDTNLYPCAYLKIDGGEISHNIAKTSNGGAILTAGKTVITGGVIEYNEALQQGDKKSGRGGGVRISSGDFIMTGGTIRYNKARSGGGIHYAEGTVGGEDFIPFEGSATFGGTAAVYGNTIEVYNKDNILEKEGIENLYIADNSDIGGLSGFLIDHISVATGKDAPRKGMNVGINMQSPDNAFAKEVENAVYNTRFFTSDNPNYYVTDWSDGLGLHSYDDLHIVKAINTNHGAVYVNKQAAPLGEIIVVEPCPYNESSTVQVTVTTFDGEDVKVEAQKDGTYTFFMPDTDVVVQAFPHTYEYTLNGNTFTATCIDTPCSKATDPVSLTFELINGKPGFEMNALDFWRSSGAVIPTIKYYKNDDLVNPLEEYPTKEGSYVAVVKINDLEAKIEFLVIDFYGNPITTSTNVEYYWDKADLVLIYKDTEKDGTLVTPADLKAWILTVGGGGAGGTVRSSAYASHAGGGGGGAGELLIREKYDLSADFYTITVGKGGIPNGTSEKSAAGGNGKDSSIKGTTLDITVKGGGGGGGESVGSAGGSGGGGSYASSAIYAGGKAIKNNEDGLANAGGASAKRYAGGGGGSASTGQNGQDSAGGNGGAGTKCSITGQEKYYAAGGGGGATNSGNGGAGGSNIGGIGAKHANSEAAAPTSGAENTGSGGGGGGRYKTGAAGGSGIVIVRFYGHDFSYSVDKDDKAVLFATCNEIDCSSNYDDEPLSLTLTEDGFDTEELTAWLNAKAQQPTIKYYATSDLTTALEEKPTENGDYVVKAIVETATAEVEFTINNHPHQLTYSLDKDGKTIIATCSNKETECSFVDHKISITLSAIGGIYDGKTNFIATTDDATTGFSGATKTTVVIKYYKGSTLLDGAPISAGNYIAKLSLKDGDGNLITDSSGNVIYASCDFTVSKKQVDAPKENTTEFIYDGKDKTYMTIEKSDPYKLTSDSASLVKSTVGTTTIKLELKDTDNYVWATGSAPTYTFTIKKATQIITADDKKSYVYEDIDKTISATVLDNATITYSIKDGEAEDVVEINSSTGALIIKKAGTTIVVVNALETDNYNSASKEIVVEVAKKKIDKPTENTDTFTYNKSQQTYIPTGFNASTMNITGNQQTIANETGYTVEVTPKENYEFSTAGDCKFTWIINKDTVTVPEENKTTFTYNGENQSYFTITGDELYVVKTGSGYDSVIQKDAGEYNVSLTLKDANNYKWKNIEKDPTYTFTINKTNYDGIKVATTDLAAKVNSTVTVQLPELPEGASYAYVAEGFSYGSSSVMDEELILTVIGSDIPDETDPFEITVNVTGAKNYTDYEVTITVTPIYHIHDFTYRVDDNVLTATCIEGCTEGYDDNCLTLTLIAFNNLVYDGLSKEVTFISEETTKWEGAGLAVPTVVYYLEDGTTKTFQGTENEGKAPTNAGKYIAKATVDTDKTAVLEFTITQREITVTITANGGTYASTITAATASFNNLVNGETVTPVITYTAAGYNSINTPTNAGNYTITVTLPLAATNYKLTGTTTSTFVVNKAVVTAPIINSKVYTGETLTADIQTSTLYTITANNGGILAGNYDVVLTLVDADNYKWSTTNEAVNTLTFTITQADNSWSTTPSIGDVTYGTAINPIGESIFGGVVIQYVGTNGTVYNGLIAPTKAGSYKATFSVVETTNYKGLSKDVEFTISKKQLEVTGTEVESTRIYNATKNANVTNVGTFVNLKTGDDVILKATAQYADKNVGTSKSITVVYTIEGTDAANYIKPIDNTSLTADITAKQLEVIDTIVTESKVYDRTTDIKIKNVGTFANLEIGDNVTLKATAEYSDKNVGENKSITVVYTIEGTDVTNYIKPVNNTSLTADITAKQLEVTGTEVESTRVYDATKDANVTNVGTFANLETGDSVTLKATAQYADKNVGTSKSITVVYTIEGTDAANYIKPIDNTSLTADITAKQLEVTGTEVESSRVYDATVGSKVTNVGTFTNLESGDSVTLKATAQYADKNVGENKSITVVYTIEGTDAANYIKPVNNTSLTADITAKQLEVIDTIVIESKVYDRTTDIKIKNIGTFTNLEAGDDVTLKATAQYADKNVGTSKVITVVYTIEGTDAANYIKPIDNTSLTADITAKQLEVTGTEVESSRIYDATVGSKVTNVGTFTNLETGDSVTLKATAEYVDKNVGENKSITVVYTIEGTDAANYIKPIDNTSLTADITKKDVPLPAKDKTTYIYNGRNITYHIATNDLYSVSGNVRKNVGKYTVKISLNDKWNYKWENVDSNDLEYSFVIYRTGNAIHDLSIEGWTDTQKGNLPTATADFGEVEFVYSKADIIDFSMTELPTVAGEYIVKAYVVGNDNYASCEDQIPFTINKTVLSDDQIGKSLVKLETEEGFGPNLILKVELIVKGDELITRSYQPIVDYKQLAERYEKVAGAYDVRLLLNGKEIQPEDLGEGTIVTAYVSLPEHLKNNEFRFLHVHSKDDVQVIDKADVAGIGTYTINEEGYLVTQIDRLSEFVFFYQPGCSMHWYMIATIVAYIALFVIFALTNRRKAIFIISAISLIATTILAFFVGCIICTIATITSFALIVIGTLWALFKMKEAKEKQQEELVENN